MFRPLACVNPVSPRRPTLWPPALPLLPALDRRLPSPQSHVLSYTPQPPMHPSVVTRSIPNSDTFGELPVILSAPQTRKHCVQPLSGLLSRLQCETAIYACQLSIAKAWSPTITSHPWSKQAGTISRSQQVRSSIEILFEGDAVYAYQDDGTLHPNRKKTKTLCCVWTVSSVI